jgi:hypothetical protein
MTFLDLFTLSAADLGVLGSGQTLKANDLKLLLLAFNGMLDTYSGMRSLLFTVQRRLYPLTVGTFVYTIGPTGVFVQPRPVTIQRAGLLLSGSTNPAFELPMRVLTDDEYASIGIKGLASTFPTSVWYDYGDVSGNGTLTFNYNPQQGGNDVALYCPQPLTQITQTQIAQTLYFPPGYQELLEYGLALRAAPKFGRSLPPEAAALGRSALAAIKARNSYTPELKMPFGRRGGYNWLTDDVTGR